VEAVESLRLGDPDAEASVQALVDSGDVGSAVEECLEAALCALNERQRAGLLHAASYAKCFVGVAGGGGSGEGHNHRDVEVMSGVRHRARLSERFVLTCRVLKARTMLDASDVMCATGAQLWARTPAMLVESLLQAAHFGAAANMCDLFGMSHKVVAVHWVRKKVCLSVCPSV
jgi:hypothetical protein